MDANIYIYIYIRNKAKRDLLLETFFEMHCLTTGVCQKANDFIFVTSIVVKQKNERSERARERDIQVCMGYLSHLVKKLF